MEDGKDEVFFCWDGGGGLDPRGNWCGARRGGNRRLHFAHRSGFVGDAEHIRGGILGARRSSVNSGAGRTRLWPQGG